MCPAAFALSRVSTGAGRRHPWPAPSSAQCPQRAEESRKGRNTKAWTRARALQTGQGETEVAAEEGSSRRRHRFNGEASSSMRTQKASPFMRKPQSNDLALGSGPLQPTRHRRRGLSDEQSHFMGLGRDTGPRFHDRSPASPEPAVCGPRTVFVKRQVPRDDLGARDRAC